jgi:hypothetical protein
MFRTYDPRAPIAHPQVAAVDTNITVFLNKASVANIKTYISRSFHSPGAAGSEGPAKHWPPWGAATQSQSCEAPYHQ